MNDAFWSNDTGTVPRDIMENPRLINSDLAPVPTEGRTWTTYDYASLWIAMTHQIPTYMAASGLIALGLSWWQAVIAIAIGNLAILVPILLNSHIGTKFGIPFPVAARSAYGVFGANLPAMMRALVACGWFGIQAWLGGAAVDQLFEQIWPAWNTIGGTIYGHPFGVWAGYLIFWSLNILIIWKGMDTLRRFENWAGPSILVIFAIILMDLVQKAHGWGPILNQPSKFHTAGAFIGVFIGAITAMMGMWATIALNIPDFSRYAGSQKSQFWGQIIGLPTTMTLFALMGVLITSAGDVVYGKVVWNPVQLISMFHQRFLVIVALAAIVILTLSVNVAANVVAPANDFANLWPRVMSFAKGGLVAAIISMVMRPWALLADPSGFIFTWLLGYGGGLGSVAGVMVIDYWVVKRTHLSLWDLYRINGIYRYSNGWNWRGLVATAIGSGIAWIGWIYPHWSVMNNYAWLTGFGLGSVTYWVFNTIAPMTGGVLDANAL